ncbi:MAG TPA: NnrS family protein, partial [Anaerolineae bacterium]
FILGMGLYFVPRLVSVKLARPDLAPYAFSLLACGIFLRTLAQPLVAISPAAGAVWQVAWIVSALAELAGLFIVGRMLFATRKIIPASALARDSHIYPLIPFVLIAVGSLFLSYTGNALGTLAAVLAARNTLAPAWDDVIIHLMLYGLAVPMAVVFSIRNLPLFLRLAPPPRALLRPLAAAYVLGLVLRVVPDLAIILNLPLPLPNTIEGVGALVTAVVILIFIWRLDLHRGRAPWTTLRAPNTRPDLDHLRRPTRAAYPDAGEYGRFELLIYSAYIWLAISALLEIAHVVFGFAQAGVVIPIDAVRHSLTLGFVTMLIFGMAVRMAPGFSGKRRVADPSLVVWTFLLGNLAALLRIVPLFFVTNPLSLSPYGLSGIIGWFAVATLAVNLVQTFRS